MKIYDEHQQLVGERERSTLRQLQTRRVMPLIGKLLDRWDELPNDVKQDIDFERVAAIIKEIDYAMEVT